MKILILNGSIHGDTGNCAVLIRELQKKNKNIDWQVVHLVRTRFSSRLVKKITDADAILCLTGTYWDSWGSPLQGFLEKATELEATPKIMGKPLAVCVLMHSVGGKAVLSRLQGVFSSMGFFIPPMSGMVYSLSGQLGLKSNSRHSRDFWCLEDLEVIIENLCRAASIKMEWASWPVDRKNFKKKWLG